MQKVRRVENTDDIWARMDIMASYNIKHVEELKGKSEAD